MDINALRTLLERKRGQQEALLNAVQARRQKVNALRVQQAQAEEARVIIQVVAAETQAQLKYHVTEVVNLAQAAVFDDPYTLSLEFVPKRGKTEAELYFMRRGDKLDPLTETGGGAINIGAFALRTAIWLLNKHRVRNTLVLDEPFAQLKGREANIRALNMVKKISHEVGLQIIMVSDERAPREDIVLASDKVFEVTMVKGVSNVEGTKTEGNEVGERIPDDKRIGKEREESMGTKNTRQNTNVFPTRGKRN